MKPLVIYHANCADGFGAAFAAHTVLGDEAEYVPMDYKMTAHSEIPALHKLVGPLYGREVYILDFSFKTKAMMQYIFDVSKRVVWLDHHKTSFEMWLHGEFKKGDKFIDHARPHEKFILLNDNKSGALLAWEYFQPGAEVPQFIKLLDDYDRWQFKLHGTKAFQKNLWSLAPWSFNQWHAMHLDFASASTFNDPLGDFITDGEAILRAHNQNVQSVVKGSARECLIAYDNPDYYDGPGLIGLAANCPSHLSSDVGHELAVKSETFGLCWHMQSDGAVKCELRSNSDFDVSAIAKAFGGGGHARAAGFHTGINALLGWLK